jgi:hypothetical protein
MQLFSELQTLLPMAIKWAEEQNNKIQKEGIPLTLEQIEIAVKVGVSNPEDIKILEVPELPLPTEPKLCEAANQIGFLSEAMKGLTIDHSIYICEDFNTTQQLSLELRRVYQYEFFGSIPAFLVEYFKQIVMVGYENSLLEQDRKKYEIC